MSLKARLHAWIHRSPRRRGLAVGFGNRLNAIGVACMVAGRRIVAWLNETFTDAKSDRRILGLPALHAEIRRILERQRAQYPHRAYFEGHPYQSLATLGIFGERPTEERFDIYGLRDVLRPGDTILDIGCNCGFMALYAAYRTGCRATGIDINPFMIEIGQRCAEYLGLQDRLSLIAGRFQEFAPRERYSVVFSFATHWTDDGNYRVKLPEHLARIHGLLQPGGLLVFESHVVDVGNTEFYAALDSVKDRFEWNGKGLTDNGHREVYLMRARAGATA